MSLTDWEQTRFNEIFDQTIHHIEKLREHDPEFSLKRLRGMLEAEYINQGNDWVGRGAVGHISSEATIAAYQQIIAQMEKLEEPGEE
ncbi:MAG: hypothetical protein ACLFNZ_03710 [Spirochaetaceae bacterium]